MLDDDLKDMRDLSKPAGEQNKVSPIAAREIILATAHAAKQAGAYLYGFNQSVIPTAYKGLRPFTLSGYIIEGWIGFHEGHKLFYPKELMLCGDYWISCLNAYFHRIIWRDDRFSFTPHKTFDNPGGQTEFRSKEAMLEAVELIAKVFGSDVVKFKKDTFLAKRKHEYQITLKMPF